MMVGRSKMKNVKVTTYFTINCLQTVMIMNVIGKF